MNVFLTWSRNKSAKHVPLPPKLKPALSPRRPSRHRRLQPGEHAHEHRMLTEERPSRGHRSRNFGFGGFQGTSGIATRELHWLVVTAASVVRLGECLERWAKWEEKEHHKLYNNVIEFGFISAFIKKTSIGNHKICIYVKYAYKFLYKYAFANLSLSFGKVKESHGITSFWNHFCWCQCSCSDVNDTILEWIYVSMYFIGKISH